MITSYWDIIRLKIAFMIQYWWVFPILAAWAIFFVWARHKLCVKEEEEYGEEICDRCNFPMKEHDDGSCPWKGGEE